MYVLMTLSTIFTILQIENEYGYYENYYKEDGKKYALWAAKMAVSQNTSVPWIMCQQWDAPDPVVRWPFFEIVITLQMWI